MSKTNVGERIARLREKFAKARTAGVIAAAVSAPHIATAHPHDDDDSHASRKQLQTAAIARASETPQQLDGDFTDFHDFQAFHNFDDFKQFDNFGNFGNQ